MRTQWCEGESVGAMAEEALIGVSNIMDRWCTGGFKRMTADLSYAFKPQRPAAAGAEQEGEGKEEAAAAAPGLKTTGEEDIYQVRVRIYVECGC